MMTIRNLTMIMMGLSGVLIFLSVYLDRDTKRRKEHTEDLNKHFEEMMDLVNHRA